MEISDLPTYMRRQEVCLWGCGPTMDIYGFCVNDHEGGIEIKMRCKKCGKTYENIFKGGHIESFNKAMIASKDKQEIKTAEDINT
jgi:hypothetical protein